MALERRHSHCTQDADGTKRGQKAQRNREAAANFSDKSQSDPEPDRLEALLLEALSQAGETGTAEPANVRPTARRRTRRAILIVTVMNDVPFKSVCTEKERATRRVLFSSDTFLMEVRVS